MKIFAAFSLVFSTVLVLSAPAQSSGFEVIAPHRAIYEITLKDVSKRSGIKNMKGRMVYEVRGNECDGIALQYRFLTRITTGKAQFVSDQRTSTFESADGKSFNFLTKSFLNQQLEETVKGVAKQTSDGSINVVLDSPSSQEFDFSKARFLTSYLVELIELAKKGEHYLRGDLFDGSDGGDETISTSSFISNPKSIANSKHQHSSDIVNDLKPLQAWSVSMSYFKKDIGATAEHLPIFESSFLLFENGVSSDLIMRYPDYSLTGKLSKLEMFADEPCQQDG
ncbi:MAG: DUF1849 family protein [Hyphomicrobiales bacterium]|nr:DUF1849 family protein [Hyphomicrobiales bacterium]